MLVLSRKHQESVVVGGSDGFHRLLKVTVLDIRAGACGLDSRSTRAFRSIAPRCGSASSAGAPDGSGETRTMRVKFQASVEE